MDTSRSGLIKRVAILQSNYIPWKGYFDLIAAVDEFVIYDDMQFTKRDWRNRNQIKTPQGLHWLTVPVEVKGKYHQKIKNTRINGSEWAKKHWRSLESNYKQAKYYKEIACWLKPLYLEKEHHFISSLNKSFIEAICEYLKIDTIISNSWDYTLVQGKTERLADLCLQTGGTVYISGPSARDYIEEQIFVERGVKLAWFDYSGYQEYPQLWGEFVHGVTILDLLFNCGKESHNYLRHVGV
jgi:hypothetical protein